MGFGEASRGEPAWIMSMIRAWPPCPSQGILWTMNKIAVKRSSKPAHHYAWKACNWIKIIWRCWKFLSKAPVSIEAIIEALQIKRHPSPPPTLATALKILRSQNQRKPQPEWQDCFLIALVSDPRYSNLYPSIKPNDRRTQAYLFP